ncbi:MAG: cobyrinate a,c-diamide synthase [Anaerolineae bacterium]|nr:cobyrinate a,c-diamide synthase [Anaerolineae bacterium]
MRLLIGGVHSGVGKTTLVSGLVRALSRRGLTVQPFKVGPDYIDPSYLTLAAGRVCRNLDSWMVPPERIPALFNQAAKDADIAVIEGVMGLFDGLNYSEDSGSSAQVARLIQAPSVLILDAAKAARSVAATALGFMQFDPQLNLAGFIINYAAGASHGAGVAQAVQANTHRPVFGWLPYNPDLKIPERHLGLVPTLESGPWLEFLDRAADFVEQYLDVNALLAVAAEAPALPETQSAILKAFPGLPAQEDAVNAPLIAVARDEAFNFIYEDNLDLLKAAGARVKFFSPLNDAALPAGCDGVFLSGGFPEMFAARLSANTSLQISTKFAYAQQIPIYAECGGLMALTQSITDLQGQTYPMFGLLPGRSEMTPRLNMGYRLVTPNAPSWLFPVAENLRCHEFHYSTWLNRPLDLPPAYLIQNRLTGEAPVAEGACIGSLWASYIHLHFWSAPHIALNFVSACRKNKERRHDA